MLGLAAAAASTRPASHKPATSTATVPNTPTTISAKRAVRILAKLKPLPKRLYAHTVVNALFHHKQLLHQWARITGTITLSGEWPNRDRCQAAAAMARKTGAKIALAASPFTGRFSWPADKPPTYDGKEWRDELHRLAWGLRHNRFWLGKNAPIAAVIISSEAFHGPAGLGVQPGNKAWNNALVKKWNSVYQTIRDALGPKPLIVYYNAGGFSWYPGGWSQEPNHDLREHLDVYCASLYQVTRPLQEIEEARKTIASARAHHVKGFVPWLALGETYQVGISAKHWHRWGDTHYRVSYDWWMGHFINKAIFARKNTPGFADWNYVPFVVVYPTPKPTNSSWLDHFQAYVHGATR